LYWSRQESRLQYKIENVNSSRVMMTSVQNINIEVVITFNDFPFFKDLWTSCVKTSWLCFWSGHRQIFFKICKTTWNLCKTTTNHTTLMGNYPKHLLLSKICFNVHTMIFCVLTLNSMTSTPKPYLPIIIYMNICVYVCDIVKDINM